MSEIKTIVATLRELFARATPQGLDTADRDDDGTYECPFCGGEGEIAGRSYTNYDGAAIGVQFFGIGGEHVCAEELFRSLIKNVPRLLDLIEPAQTEGQ